MTPENPGHNGHAQLRTHRPIRRNRLRPALSPTLADLRDQYGTTRLGS